MSCLAQDFQQASGDAVGALDRLVGVGDRAKRQRRRAVAGHRQFLPQAIGQIGAREQPGFEIQAG